ncbi:MAG TPA: hypothetical protein VFH54_14405 [Mycobacteriales bacterium]|nr:hypothetical protein [Mycobacteriales bacterium]
MQIVEYFWSPEGDADRHHETVFFTRTYWGAKRIRRRIHRVLAAPNPVNWQRGEAQVAAGIEERVEITEAWHVRACRCSKCRRADQ